MLVWLTYFEVILNKIWENDKLSELESTEIAYKIYSRKNALLGTPKNAINNFTLDKKIRINKSLLHGPGSSPDLQFSPEKLESSAKNIPISNNISNYKFLKKKNNTLSQDINKNKVTPVNQDNNLNNSNLRVNQKTNKNNPSNNLFLTLKKVENSEIKVINNVSELEIPIPNENVAISVFDKYSHYMTDYDKIDKKEASEENFMRISTFKKRYSTKASSLRIQIQTDEEEIKKMKQWYKIRNFYNHYNLFIKMNWMLYSEAYFELMCLGILLWSYNLLSTISSLIYLIVIGFLCFIKHSSKIVFFKNFCLLFFNFKYLCFFINFYNPLSPQTISKTISDNNLMNFILSKQKLPSSYFSIGISEQEFLAFLLLFLILFNLQLYIIVNLKITKYISHMLYKTFNNFNTKYMENEKILDYNDWEQKSNRFFINLQEYFFEFFDKIVILSVGFFSIFDYYFFNMIIFFSSIILIFLQEFQTQWGFLNHLNFLMKYFKFLQYFSFLALCFNHILAIPQISDDCSHVLCSELGSKLDKLYNIFILHIIITFIRLRFYKDYDKYSKMQTFKVSIF